MVNLKKLLALFIGDKKYLPNWKKINVNKSVAEIDWILPLIYELKDDFRIFTLSQNREAYNTLLKDKLLYNIWKEVSLEYKIENKIEKAWRFLDSHIFNKFFSNKNLITFFRYNIKGYFKKKKINFSEIAIFFTEFGTYSPHIKYIKKALIDFSIKA